MVMPFSVTTIRSLRSSTSLMPTTSPLRSLVLMVIMPMPLRCWRLYSLNAVRLPYPFSHTDSTSGCCASLGACSMPTTSSPLDREMPRTPLAGRPMGRASFSSKRMDLPCLVAIIMSLLPNVICTLISTSPSSKPMAIMPVLRMLANSFKSTRLTLPKRVHIVR